MAVQIAVRIPETALSAVDAAVAAGRFDSRAAAVREGLERLLDDERERAIGESYRRAYSDQPQDESLGEAGAALLAEAVRELQG